MKEGDSQARTVRENAHTHKEGQGYTQKAHKQNILASSLALGRLRKIKLIPRGPKHLTLVTYFKAKEGEPMAGRALMLEFLPFSCETVSLSHIGVVHAASEPP